MVFDLPADSNAGFTFRSGNSYTSRLRIDNTNTTIYSPLNVQQIQLTNQNTYIYNTTGYNDPATRASINIEVYGGHVRFITGTNGLDRLERMKIFDDGKIHISNRLGIGTAAPTSKLDVKTSMGPELVSDPSFDDADAWSQYNGATISGGVAYLPNGGSYVNASPTPLTAGKTYQYTVTAKSTNTTGDLRIDSNGVQDTIENLPLTYTTYTGYFIAGSSSLLLSEGGQWFN
jgi:hypothetical protein